MSNCGSEEITDQADSSITKVKVPAEATILVTVRVTGVGVDTV